MYSTDEVARDLSESLARYYIDLSNRRDRGKALKVWQKNTRNYPRACKIIYTRTDVIIERKLRLERLERLLES